MKKTNYLITHLFTYSFLKKFDMQLKSYSKKKLYNTHTIEKHTWIKNMLNV